MKKQASNKVFKLIISDIWFAKFVL
jgi:hypothetical protein